MFYVLQVVAQGAQDMGLAGAGQSESQDVDAPVDEAALGQLVHLLPQRQGHPVVFEEPAPVNTGVSRVLPEGSLDSLRSRLMRRCFRFSASSSTSRKVGRASPWPAAVKRDTDRAPMADSLNWWHSWPMRSCMTLVSVIRTPPPRPQACGQQAVVDFQVRLADQGERRGLGRLWLRQVAHLRVVEGLVRFQQQGQGAVHRGFHSRRRQVQDAHVFHVSPFPAPLVERTS